MPVISHLSTVEVRAAYSSAGEEPPVEELLADSVVRAIMARDRVDEAHLRALISDARTALSQRAA